MSQSIIIEVAGEQYRKLGFHTYISDFANILKAFIGSNFLSIPFGFGQCGLLLGVIALVVIGGLTIHGAHLLVKAKYHAIKHVLHVYRHPNNFAVKVNYHTQSRWHKNTFGSKLNLDHLLPAELLNPKGNSDERKEEISNIQRQLVTSMQFGDLARLCFGQFGVTVTNIAILITQLGFCINYAIFTATAVQSFFPVYNCTVQVLNNALISSPGCRYLFNSPEQLWMDKFSSNESKIDLSSSVTSALADAEHENSHIFSNFTSQNQSAGFAVPNASLNQEQSLSSLPSGDLERSTSSISHESSVRAILSLSSEHPVFKTVPPYPGSSDLSTSSTKPLETAESSANTSTSIAETSSVNQPVSALETQTTVETQIPISAHDDLSVSLSPGPSVWSVSFSDSPDIRFLFLIPIVIFVILILPRRMRGLGLISTVGNVSLICGTLVVIVALINQFHVTDTWVWARLQGLPIFFGTVAGAFEGAGAMLPVEGSMEGNRHNYAPYVTGALTILVLLHICTGVLSYLSFGSDISQVVSMNLDMGSWLGVTVNVFLMVGILFTFPIMVFPVVQMVEATLFGKDNSRQCQHSKDEEAEEEAMLMPDSHLTQDSADSEVLMIQVAPWKRNVVRISLVLVIGLLGLLFRDSFAYVAAFVGAVGSIFVAYILPCLFHMKLCWHHLPAAIKFKDVFIISLGVVFCVTGIYSVIMVNIL